MAMRFRMTLKPWPVSKPCCTRTFHRTKCTPCTGEFLLDSSPPTQIPRVHVCSSRSRLTMIPCKGCSMPTSPTGIPRNASHISMLVMNTHMLRSDSTSSLWHALSERFFMQRVSRHHARYSTGLRPWRHLSRLEMKSRSHPCRWDLHASVPGLSLGRLAVLPVRSFQRNGRVEKRLLYEPVQRCRILEIGVGGVVQREGVAEKPGVRGERLVDDRESETSEIYDCEHRGRSGVPLAERMDLP